MGATLTAPPRHSQLSVWLLALVCALGVWAAADSASGGQNPSKRADLASGPDAFLFVHTEQLLAVKRTPTIDREDTELGDKGDDWRALVDVPSLFQPAQDAAHLLIYTHLGFPKPAVGQLLNAPRAPPVQHS